eukprot:3411017-Rhodomonas_salina.4
MPGTDTVWCYQSSCGRRGTRRMLPRRTVDSAISYALATRSPVLTHSECCIVLPADATAREMLEVSSSICLCVSYAMSGTDIRAGGKC